MKPNKHIFLLWGIFLVLGIILFVMQIYLAQMELKQKNMLQSFIDSQSKNGKSASIDGSSTSSFLPYHAIIVPSNLKNLPQAQ